MLNEELGTNIKPIVSGEFRISDNRHDFADNSGIQKDFWNLEFTDLRKSVHILFDWSMHEESIDSLEIADELRRNYLVH